MNATPDFFDEYRYWSGIKHRILTDYVKSYLRIRGGSCHDIYLVDGFAGSGRYIDGDTTRKGSPVLLWEAVRNARAAGLGCRLHCIFVEQDAQRVDTLRGELSSASPDAVTILEGKFSSHVARILSTLGTSPAIVFLDPCGVMGMEFANLIPLFRRPNTEFLINFSSPTIRRLAGFDTSDAKDAEGKRRRLNLTLGDDVNDPSPHWRSTWRNRQDSSEWIAEVAHDYIRKIQLQSPDLRHAITYPIRSRWKGTEKYYLVFASRSIKAFGPMNDLVLREDDQLLKESDAAKMPTGQLGLFGSYHEPARDDDIAHELEQLPELIIGLQRSVELQGRTVSDIIDTLCLTLFGKFYKRQFRSAIKALVANERARYGPGQADKRRIYFLS